MSEKAIAFTVLPLYFVSISGLLAYIGHKIHEKAIAFSVVLRHPTDIIPTSCRLRMILSYNHVTLTSYPMTCHTPCGQTNFENNDEWVPSYFY